MYIIICVRVDFSTGQASPANLTGPTSLGWVRADNPVGQAGS